MPFGGVRLRSIASTDSQRPSLPASSTEKFQSDGEIAPHTRLRLLRAVEEDRGVGVHGRVHRADSLRPGSPGHTGARPARLGEYRIQEVRDLGML